jgi:acyl-CoA reductase-like NAD-dependent aldehyde dehydrogenase
MGIDVIDSTTGYPMGAVTASGAEDVDRAVTAARSAFQEWSLTTPQERAEALESLADALESHEEEAADTISLEVGTPSLISKRIQVGLPVATLRAFAEAARNLNWENTIGNSLVVREPAGVVGAITPWNYPLHQLVGKVGGALAAGCTVIAKPSDQAPLSTFILASACEEAGIPPGVFNLVPGSGRVVGETMAAHPGIDVLSFTGSTKVGARVAALAAPNITRVALELGGKSASIVLDDADFARAVKTSVGNAFLNSGQTCSAWTRLLVPRQQHDEVVDMAVAAAHRLTLGHPLAEGTRLGPLVSAKQQASVQAHIRTGMNEGRLVLGGADQPSDLPDGFYVKPTIFANVDPSASIAQEEIFGPVLVIIPYEDDSDAVRIANDTPYGLSGGVWSADSVRAMRVARQISAGQIDINGAPFNPASPFGGYKQSGLGREFGPYGIEEFTEIKAIQC